MDRCSLLLLLSLALLSAPHLARGVMYFTAANTGVICSSAGNGCSSTVCRSATPCQVPSSPYSAISADDIAFFSGEYNSLAPFIVNFTGTAAPNAPNLKIYLASDGTTGMQSSLQGNFLTGLKFELSTDRKVELVGMLNNAVNTQLTNCEIKFTLRSDSTQLTVLRTEFLNARTASAITYTTTGDRFSSFGVSFSKFSTEPGTNAPAPAILFKLLRPRATAFIPTLSSGNVKFFGRTAFGTQSDSLFHYVAPITVTQSTFTAPITDFYLDAQTTSEVPTPINAIFVSCQVDYQLANSPVALDLLRSQHILFDITDSSFSIGGATVLSFANADSSLALTKVTMNNSLIDVDGINSTIQGSQIVNGSQFTTTGSLFVNGSFFSKVQALGSTTNLTISRTTVASGGLSVGAVISFLHSNITETMFSSGATQAQFTMIETYLRNPGGLSVDSPFNIINSTVEMTFGSPSYYFRIGTSDPKPTLGIASGLTVLSPIDGDFRIGNVVFGLGSSIQVDTMQLVANRPYFASLTVKKGIYSSVFNGGRLGVNPTLLQDSRANDDHPVVWTLYSLRMDQAQLNLTGVRRLDYYHSEPNGIVSIGGEPLFTLEPSLPLRIVWALESAAPAMGSVYNLYGQGVYSTNALTEWEPRMLRETSDAYLFNSTVKTTSGIFFQMAPPPPSVISLPPNTGTVTIPGNVTTDEPIVFTGTGTTLILDGCAINVTAGLLYTFDGKLPNGTYLALVQNADCPESLETIPLSVAAPKARECEENKAIRGSESSKTQLFVLFLLDDSKCSEGGRKSWPIIVGSVLGGVAVIAVVVTIVSVQLWKAHRKHGEQADLARASA